MIQTQTLALPASVRAEKKTPSRRTRKAAHARRPGASIGFALATFAMGIAYLLTMNAQSTIGYALHKLEVEKTVLTQEIRTLDSRIGELSSIGVIETAARSMEFVAAEDVKYFVGETGVAAIDRMQP